MDVLRAVPLLLLGAGCGASTSRGSVGDGATPADSAAPDAPDGRACPPPELADAGGEVPAPGGPYVVELSLDSQTHQCARMSDGTVRCQGSNSHGQLGIGVVGGPHRDPVTVPGLTDVEQVLTIDFNATCTRHRDGLVRCWGSSLYELLDEERSRVARPALVPGLTDVVHLATAAPRSVCAVRRDGSVWCWGASANGLLPPGGSPTPVQVGMLSNVTALWSRGVGWVARLRDGRYVTTSPPLGAVTIPPEAGIAEGPSHQHLCYRLPDTSVRCFGDNSSGQIGNGASSLTWVREPWDPGLCGVRSVVAAFSHTCAVLADRTVACWGDAGDGSLGVDTGERCTTGRVPWSCVTRPTRVPGIDHVDRLFVGFRRTCALRTDRSVWCWGYQDPDRTGRPVPVQW